MFTSRKSDRLVHSRWAFVLLIFFFPMVAAGQTSPEIDWMIGGHGSGVLGVAFSPDGQLVATASNDKTLKIWRVSDGTLLKTFTSPGSQLFELHSVAFSPDGEYLVSTGSGEGYIWRISDGSSMGFCDFGFEHGCMETGFAAAFSDDGSLLAVSGTLTGVDSDTMVYRFSDGELLHHFTGTNNFNVMSVVFAPDGQTVITGEGPLFFGNTGVIRFWDLATDQVIHELNDHSGSVRALAISPDGQMLASGSWDRTIKLWNLADVSLIRTLTGHNGEVTDLDFSPDSSKLVSSSQDATLKIWDVDTGNVQQTLTGHENAIESVGWAPDGELIISGAGRIFYSDEDHSVRLWDADDGTPLGTLTQLHTRLVTVRLSSDDTTALTATGREHLVLRSALDGAEIRSFNPGFSVNSADFSLNGDIVTAGLWDRNLKIWDATTGDLLHTIEAHDNSVRAVAVSPDSTLVAAGDWDGPAKLYRVSDGGLHQTFNNSNLGAFALSFSPDGSRLAVSGSNQIQIRNVNTGAVLQTLAGHTSSVFSMDFSNDGSLLASCSSDASANIWRVSDGALLHTLVGSQYWVECVAFSTDGRILATGSRDKTLRLWRVSDGQLLQTYDVNTGSAVSSIDCSSDNSFFIFGRQDASVVRMQNPFNVQGDLDVDGDVDLEDYTLFAPCLAGPGTNIVPDGCDPEVLPFADLDRDADVDLYDYAIFMEAFLDS